MGSGPIWLAGVAVAAVLLFFALRAAVRAGDTLAGVVSVQFFTLLVSPYHGPDEGAHFDMIHQYQRDLAPRRPDRRVKFVIQAGPIAAARRHAVIPAGTGGAAGLGAGIPGLVLGRHIAPALAVRVVPAGVVRIVQP